MLDLPSPETYAELDGEAVARFNARYGGTNYELQVRRGAKCGAGDILNARVLLLYANPGYDPTIDKQEPIHFSLPGWPLVWLHPESAHHHPGAHRWLCSRLRHLIERYGAQFVSQNVANMNIVPWSSREYKAGLSLPSREVQLDLARRSAERGAILVAVRARAAWRPLLEAFPGQVVLTRNPRSSHISPGNLGADGWQRVVLALDAVHRDPVTP